MSWGDMSKPRPTTDAYRNSSFHERARKKQFYLKVHVSQVKDLTDAQQQDWYDGQRIYEEDKK